MNGFGQEVWLVFQISSYLRAARATEAARNASMKRRKASQQSATLASALSGPWPSGSSLRTVHVSWNSARRGAYTAQQLTAKAPTDRRTLVVAGLLIHLISGASSSHSLDGDVV